MAIVTTAEVKTLLQISGTSQDTLIDTLIPLVQDYVLAYCNTNFPIKNRYVRSGNITFTSGTPAMINDAASSFVDAKFTDGMHVLISGSVDNDKIVEVETVTAGVLTLAAGETLITETFSDTDIFLQKIKFPTPLKNTVAKMIGFNLEKNTSKGKKSEKVGSYSVSFSTEYPENIMAELRTYRKVAF